jgi:hypothetical protein
MFSSLSFNQAPMSAVSQNELWMLCAFVGGLVWSSTAKAVNAGKSLAAERASGVVSWWTILLCVFLAPQCLVQDVWSTWFDSADVDSSCHLAAETEQRVAEEEPVEGELALWARGSELQTISQQEPAKFSPIARPSLPADETHEKRLISLLKTGRSLEAARIAEPQKVTRAPLARALLRVCSVEDGLSVEPWVQALDALQGWTSEAGEAMLHDIASSPIGARKLFASALALPNEKGFTPSEQYWMTALSLLRKHGRGSQGAQLLEKLEKPTAGQVKVACVGAVEAYDEAAANYCLQHGECVLDAEVKDNLKFLVSCQFSR